MIVGAELNSNRVFSRQFGHKFCHLPLSLGKFLSLRELVRTELYQCKYQTGPCEMGIQLHSQ